MIRAFVAWLLSRTIVFVVVVIVIIFLGLLAICWMMPGSAPCELLETFGLNI